MDAKQFLVLGASMLAASLTGPVAAQDPHQPYVRVAEIEIDPSQIEPYKAAVKEQIEAAVRLEPGVLALYSVADKENPSHVFVFEMLPTSTRTSPISRRLISRNTRRLRRTW